MKLFMFAASLRKDSVNKQLISLAATLVTEAGHEIDLADFSEFDVPLYNQDIQDSQGFPEAITQFIKRMQNAQGLIISVPEYNYSIPGPFKNLIDWVSRVNPMPWRNQCIQLLSASPALVGGNRGLWQTRVPLECCGALVSPNMFSLASAYEAFTPEGKLKSSQSHQLLLKMLNDFFSLLTKLG
jgi:NAD(P)H-dependent FMN reductase